MYSACGDAADDSSERLPPDLTLNDPSGARRDNVLVSGGDKLTHEDVKVTQGMLDRIPG
jgi:hypothetical protein